MRFRASRSAKLRALVASVSAIALLSGFALVSNNGRSRWDAISVIFLVASAIALLILLQAITAIATKTMSGSYSEAPNPKEIRDRQETDTDREAAE
tara:strand:+ start:665578 stop:665865 length:288 start_codon:yes stop_codon:yes gene_type:complete